MISQVRPSRVLQAMVALLAVSAGLWVFYVTTSAPAEGVGADVEARFAPEISSTRVDAAIEPLPVVDQALHGRGIAGAQVDRDERSRIRIVLEDWTTSARLDGTVQLKQGETDRRFRLDSRGGVDVSVVLAQDLEVSLEGYDSEVVRSRVMARSAAERYLVVRLRSRTGYRVLVTDQAGVPLPSRAVFWSLEHPSRVLRRDPTGFALEARTNDAGVAELRTNAPVYCSIKGPSGALQLARLVPKRPATQLVVESEFVSVVLVSSATGRGLEDVGYELRSSSNTSTRFAGRVGAGGRVTVPRGHLPGRLTLKTRSAQFERKALPRFAKWVASSTVELDASLREQVGEPPVIPVISNALLVNARSALDGSSLRSLTLHIGRRAVSGGDAAWQSIELARRGERFEVPTRIVPASAGGDELVLSSPGYEDVEAGSILGPSSDVEVRLSPSRTNRVELVLESGIPYEDDVSFRRFDAGPPIVVSRGSEPGSWIIPSGAGRFAVERVTVVDDFFGERRQEIGVGSTVPASDGGVVRVVVEARGASIHVTAVPSSVTVRVARGLDGEIVQPTSGPGDTVVFEELEGGSYLIGTPGMLAYAPRAENWDGLDCAVSLEPGESIHVAWPFAAPSGDASAPFLVLGGGEPSSVSCTPVYALPGQRVGPVNSEAHVFRRDGESLVVVGGEIRPKAAVLSAVVRVAGQPDGAVPAAVSGDGDRVTLRSSSVALTGLFEAREQFGGSSALRVRPGLEAVSRARSKGVELEHRGLDLDLDEVGTEPLELEAELPGDLRIEFVAPDGTVKLSLPFLAGHRTQVDVTERLR